MVGAKLGKWSIWIFLGVSLKANAIDLQPGDLTPLPAGVSAVQFAYGSLEQQGSYRRGNRISSAPNIEVDLYQLRLMHYFSVAEQPAVIYVQQPWGNAHATGLPSGGIKASGALDTSLLFAFWPYSNAEKQTHFAIGAYYFAPTGSYDNRAALNLGENRSSVALQSGFQTRISKNLDWLLAADAVRYGTNDAFGSGNAQLDRQPLYTVQTGLNYFFTPTIALGGAYFHTFGGATSINGVSRNDAARIDRFMITGTLKLPSYKSVLNVHYGRDIETENGILEVRRLILRYTQLF